MSRFLPTLLPKLLRLLALPVHWPVYALAWVMPKDSRVWLFGAWGGWRYCDNAQWLFEHVNHEHPDIRAIWITRSAEVRERLRSHGYECHRMFSLRGYWCTMRAGAAICTHPHASDHNLFALGGRTRIIQLWHGTPIKKIGRDDLPKRRTTETRAQRLRRALNRVASWIFPMLIERMHVFAAASEATVPIYVSAFGLARHQIRVTGQARTDALLRRALGVGSSELGVRSPHSFEEVPKLSTPDSRLPARALRVLYMPTFRGVLGDAVDVFSGFSLEECERTMQAIGGRLYLRVHPSNHPDAATYERLLASSFVEHFGCEDVYADLARFDLLITDYSSITFDYLLLDRPIVFAPFDLATYVGHDRELYFDYKHVAPGPKARSWSEVFEWVARLAADASLYDLERRAVRDRFNAFRDGRSAERTTAMLRAELGIVAPSVGEPDEVEPGLARGALHVARFSPLTMPGTDHHS